MTGPLAPLFAQAREALDAESDGFCAWCQCSIYEQPHASECEGRRALAALSSIERHVQNAHHLIDVEWPAQLDALEVRAVAAERHVQNMEGALTVLRRWDMLDACHDGPWAKALIDAALPAREKEEE